MDSFTWRDSEDAAISFINHVDGSEDAPAFSVRRF
jgi:hypothetical protein